MTPDRSSHRHRATVGRGGRSLAVVGPIAKGAGTTLDPDGHRDGQLAAGQATKVTYAEPGTSAASFQRSVTCTLPVADIAARLREAIEAAGLWVLHEIDPQALLRRGGYAIGAARQILFFHPDRMASLLAADPSALLEAPLKFAVLELPGGAVVVRWIDPAAAFARYGNPALADLGLDLATACEEIVAAGLGAAR